MNERLHRDLLAARTSTTAQLRASHPELVRELTALVRRAEHQRLYEAVGHLPEHVRARVKEVDFTSASGDLVEHLRIKLQAAGIDRGHLEHVIACARKTRLGHGLPPTQPIGTDPVVLQQLARAEVHEVAVLAGLPSAAAAGLEEAVPATSAIGDATLTRLVSQHVLTDAQASDVGFATALYEVAGNDPTLASAVRSASFASLGNKAPASMIDLASIAPTEWTQFLTAANVALPNGTTPSAFAASLARRFASIHPAAAFAARLPVGTQHEMLVHQVVTQLGQTRLLDLDLGADSQDLGRLGLASLGANDQQMVLSALRGYQRAWSLANDIDDAHALVNAGFTSALAVAGQPFETFHASSGLDPRTAKNIWQAARTTMADVSLTAASLADVMHGMFGRLAVGNLAPSAQTLLARLPGFAELFGNLGFCDCEECRSILGPAAYFVDLMKYIDDNLRTAFKKAGHPIDLRTRRPDLWTLELSCDNTDQRIPTLDIVAEVLENYIFGSPLADRATIRTQVYENTLAVTVDSFHQPFHLPLARIASYLNALETPRSATAEALAVSRARRAQAELAVSAEELPLITTRETELGRLSHLYEVTFDGSPTAVGVVDAQVLSAAMGLSRDALGDVLATSFVAAGGPVPTIIASKRDAKSVQNDVENVDGLTAEALDRMHRFTRLQRKVDWSIVELDLVLATLAAPSLDAATVLEVADLHAVKRRLDISVPELCALVGPIPRVPASTSLFDRLFNGPSFVGDGRYPKSPPPRFVHPALRETTPAPPDPALPRLLAGLSTDLDGLLALVRHLAAHLAQEATPRFDPEAAKDDDRYFVLSADNLTLLYRHARLARLLGLTTDQLFQSLGFLGLDHVASVADVLAIIELEDWRTRSGHRHDEIAVAMGQPPRDATGFPDAAVVAADVVAAVGTALTFSETVFALALGTTEQASRDLLAKNETTIVETLPTGKWRLTAAVDLDTVAIVIPPTALVSTAPSGTRLVTAAEVRDVLRGYLVREVLLRTFAAALDVAVDKVVALVALARQSLTSDAVVKAARGDGAVAPLLALVTAVRPLAVALAAPVWNARAIDFVRAHPELFGADDLPHTVADAVHPSAPFLSYTQLQSLSTYGRFATPAMVVDLEAALLAFDPAKPEFPPSSDSVVARLLSVPSGLVVGLRGHCVLPPTAAAALERLDRAARLAISVGVDGETFGSLVSDDYSALSHAADALQSALAARYSDEKTRTAKLDEAEQVVREAKRDALADYLIHSIKPTHWHTVDELYEYFLIDVEAGGCSTTSRLVSATMTAQIYVHRAIMHLERDARPETDPLYVDVGFKPRDPITGDDPAAEWSWRKNYRVWQANRKVFLWPENYLEPDLRDDKTPLFKELEQELLQTDINDQNVIDAYTKYLSGFEELGSLVIAGAYHDVRTRAPITTGQVGDVLHLFGATASDPPTYYYRTCDNLIASGHNKDTPPVWSSWHKVPVQITGRKVSPIVHQGRLHVFWVDVKTRPLNGVSGGDSTFAGYRHTMSLKLTTLRPDGTWTAPQDIELGEGFSPSKGQIPDPTESGVARLDSQRLRTQTESIDDYTLSGPNWDCVWPLSVPGDASKPAHLQLMLRNFVAYSEVDLFTRKTANSGFASVAKPWPQLVHARTTETGKDLWCGTPAALAWPVGAFANAAIDDARLETIALEQPFVPAFVVAGLDVEQIARLPATAELLAVPGSETDVIVQVGSDVVMLQGSIRDDGTYVVRRLGSTLVEPTARRFFEHGLDDLLSIHTQLGLAEAGLPITLVGSRIETTLFNGAVPGRGGTLDFAGPCGAYYRELYFHIPFLIANALSSRGRFQSAQRWYHYIFDPTAPREKIDLTGVPLEERAHRLLDRVWRYREFRGLHLEHLRDMLFDPATIALYKKDPFNPWTIARQRIGAFQKAIVMRYVDNLIDWADSLFTQFTMESVNEAMMLYIMASDVLGPRPPKLGDCGEGVEPNTYEEIAPLVEQHEMFAELETFVIGARVSPPSASVPRYAIPAAVISSAASRAPLAVAATAPTDSGVFRGLGQSETRTASWGPALAMSTESTRSAAGGRSVDHATKADFASRAGGFGWSFVRQLIPVFCVPVNADLLAYWDRVEDRLYKIRHCMDIDGQKRELALFAPPIDPMQLVAMKAAGLGLDDVLGVGTGDLPPYRFLYLLDRAKTFAATLSGFGGSLLSALEKKDGEQLNRLRLTQQLNLTRQTTHVRQLEVAAAAEALEAANRQLESAQLRFDQYADLLASGLSSNESAEQLARRSATIINVAGSTASFIAGVLGLTPQLGSPFAMKFGGVELYHNATGNASAASLLADVANGGAALAGLEGSFARRREGWTNQKAVTALDIKSLERQVKAAEIRLDIANRALQLHEKSLDQAEEFLELTDGKLTSFGLYAWMATQLQRLYRTAYQNALGLAKLAEHAYRFERGDDTLPTLATPHWDPAHAGLLAGERLLIDLQTLERRFLETNYRTLEVDQPFALSQIDAAALVELRETGSCTFQIDELFFDLFYPGQYKRRIKAVRVTLPCITGPYVNVSATLTLDASWIRPTTTAGRPLVEVPPSRSVSIATSTAQNDAGVFELSFRDERYMPFEGLGAISKWNLELPGAFKQFDYQTINDVILSVSYTAEYDGGLRDRVENESASVKGSIVKYLSETSVRRVFSLRQDFSSAFTRLLRSPAGTAVNLELTDRNFPLFVRDQKLEVERGVVLLRTAGGHSTGFSLTLDGAAITGFTADPTLGGLLGKAAPGAFTAKIRGPHTLAISSPGELAPATAVPGDVSAIDADKLLDVLLYLEYRVAAPS